MHVHAFIEEMERLAPPELAEEYDAEKIGLVVEGRPVISRVCCALDATPDVVKQAVIASADMLVVHHTPLWTPVTTITGRISRIDARPALYGYEPLCHAHKLRPGTGRS